MKVMWHGVPAAFRTGYGCQTGLFTTALKRRGVEVIISSIVPAMPTYTDANGIVTLSAGPRGNAGNDLLAMHIEAHKPDLVLSLMDTFVCVADCFGRIPWAAMQIVDSAPLSPVLLRPAKIARWRIAISRFGERVLQEAGVPAHAYIPHCYSPEQFYPEERAVALSRIEAALGRTLDPDTVLLVANSANMSHPSRKNFAAMFRAVSIVARELAPRPVLFYLHTESSGKLYCGEDLPALARATGIADITLFAPQYDYITGLIGADWLRAWYSVCDVFLHAAKGEGFGLPIIEAQACGAYIVAPDNSTMPELVRNGELVAEGVPCGLHAPGTFGHAVSDAALARAVLHALSIPRSLRRLDTPPAAVREYAVDNVVDNYLMPFLTEAVT